MLLIGAFNIQFSTLLRFGPLPEQVLALYTHQILKGVAYLHLNRVIHRDLKGNNIMLMPTGVIKLIDFGCARRLSCLNHTACNSGELLKSVHGTPFWMAPEVTQFFSVGFYLHFFSLLHWLSSSPLILIFLPTYSLLRLSTSQDMAGSQIYGVLVAQSLKWPQGNRHLDTWTKWLPCSTLGLRKGWCHRCQMGSQRMPRTL